MPPAAPLTGMAAAAAAAAQRACVPPHAAPSQAPRAGAATSLVLFELWARGRAQRAPASIPSFLHGARVQRARTLLPPLAPLCEETGLHRSKPLPRAPPARRGQTRLRRRPLQALSTRTHTRLRAHPPHAEHLTLGCTRGARRLFSRQSRPTQPLPQLATPAFNAGTAAVLAGRCLACPRRDTGPCLPVPPAAAPLETPPGQRQLAKACSPAPRTAAAAPLAGPCRPKHVHTCPRQPCAAFLHFPVLSARAGAAAPAGAPALRRREAKHVGGAPPPGAPQSLWCLRPRASACSAA